MKDEEAIEELKILQRAFGFNGEKGTSEYYYLRDEEPENYKTALAIETVLNLIKKLEQQISNLETAGQALEKIYKAEIEKKDKIQKEVAEEIDNVAVELSKLTDNIFIINQAMKLQKIAEEKLGKFYID